MAFSDLSDRLTASFKRLRSRGVLTESDVDQTISEIRRALIDADVALPVVRQFTTQVREKAYGAARSRALNPGQQVVRIVHDELVEILGGETRELHFAQRGPTVFMLAGLQGAGKTTTTGKMARIFRAEGHEVLLGAADTFRAAAAEQLETWGSRVGVDVVRSDREGADPASVAFESVEEGIRRGCDVVMVDTAGRLQTKSALMDELGKVKRVMEKRAPVSEVLLVLDATTGQNGLRQAEVFAEVAGVTGIVLSKLDGSAKGGIVVSVQRTLGVPVKFVGLGEGPDDLAPFDPESFVDAIVG